MNLFTFFRCLVLMLLSSSALACLQSEQENNDSQGAANSGVCSGTLIQGSIDNSRDTDWYQFDTSAQSTISIELTHHRRDNFDWRLVNANGQTLLRGQSTRSPDLGSVSNAPVGEYYVEIIRIKGRGWYDLTINFSGGSGSNNGDCGYGGRPSKPSNLTEYLTGSSADACGDLVAAQGSVLLMGGGADVDEAFSNRVRNHIGSNVDTVVLRTSGSDGYNDYLQSLLNADSVSTLIVDSQSKANSAYVDWMVRSAEFVWMAGGDQSDYLNSWLGTALQSAIQHVYDKGGVVGGTSAGMALLSDTIYDPDSIAGAVSDEVVTDFCHNTLNFSSRFINIPHLDNSIADTHFYERDRMGRLMVFMANQSSNTVGIGASEGTSIFIPSNGIGVVDGRYEVYVLRETSNTDLLQASCGSDVIYNNVERVKLLSGDSFNFINGTHTGQTIDVSIDGRYTDFYIPSNPY